MVEEGERMGGKRRGRKILKKMNGPLRAQHIFRSKKENQKKEENRKGLEMRKREGYFV